MPGIIRGLWEKRSDESLAGAITGNNTMFGGGTNTGVMVTPDTALRTTAVSACVRVLSETMAMLPLHLFKISPDGRGREKATGHYLYQLLQYQPNPEMSSYDYRDALVGHLAGWGNAFSLIEFNKSNGQIQALWPLRPDTTTMWRETRTHKVWYAIQLPDSMGGGYDWRPADEIWHLRIFSKDGKVGRSIIRNNREAIGLAQATEEFGARFFGNGARPGVVLEYPGKFKDSKAVENIKESWINQHEGLENSHRVTVLEEGMKLQEIGIPPEDAQFLETRKFQVVEIARMFRVQPHMIGALEQATNNNIENQSMEFVTRTIMPWAVNLESSIHNVLLTPSEQKKYYAKFIMASLLRGDTLTRFQSYSYGRQWGWLSANDVRELEDMNPVDGGESYMAPLNMTIMDQLGKGAVGGRSGETDPASTLGQPFAFRTFTPNSKRAEERLIRACEGILLDGTKRILKREVQDLRAIAKKNIPSGDNVLFEEKVNQFYDDHANWVRSQQEPILLNYGDLAGEQTAEQVGIDAPMEDIRNNTRAFLERVVKNHLENSLILVLGTTKRAIEAGSDPVAALENELDGWLECRSGKLSKEISKELIEETSKFVCELAGNGVSK